MEKLGAEEISAQQAEEMAQQFGASLDSDMQSL
jgi:hypothetical protein